MGEAIDAVVEGRANTGTAELGKTPDAEAAKPPPEKRHAAPWLAHPSTLDTASKQRSSHDKSLVATPPKLKAQCRIAPTKPRAAIERISAVLVLAASAVKGGLRTTSAFLDAA